MYKYFIFKNYAWILWVLIILANLILTFYGGWVIGISSDEPIHVGRLKSFYEFGWYLLDGQIDRGSPKSEVKNTYVYGPIAALFAHLIAVFVGVEQHGVVSFSAEAYAARHVGVGILSLFGLAATAAITRLILGSWTWGLISAALLSSLPLWSGHAMFNIKDIPVASGFSITTLGLLLIYRGTLEKKTYSQFFLPVVITLIGLMLAVGTRLGMWAFVMVSLMVGQLTFLCVSLGSNNLATLLAENMKAIGWICLSLALSYLLLWHIYPNAFDSPLTIFLESAYKSTNYNIWNGGWLTNGRYHGQPPPLWYWPAWLLHETPIGMLILWMVGLGVSFIALLQPINKSDDFKYDGVKAIGLALIITQALFGPLVSILLKSTVYSGTRQFMFIYPALSILGAVGLYHLFKFLMSTIKPKMAFFLTGVITFIAIINPFLDQLRLFPYSYAYLNELATLKTIEGRWPSDYWRTSVRALIQKADANFVIDCRGTAPEPLKDVFPLVIPETWNRSFPIDLTEGCGDFRGNPYIQQSLLFNSNKPKEKYYLIGINRHGVRIPDNCSMIHEEKRFLRGEKFVMGWLAMCNSDSKVIIK